MLFHFVAQTVSSVHRLVASCRVTPGRNPKPSRNSRQTQRTSSQESSTKESDYVPATIREVDRMTM